MSRPTSSWQRDSTQLTLVRASHRSLASVFVGDLGIRDCCSLHHSTCLSNALSPKFLKKRHFVNATENVVLFNIYLSQQGQRLESAPLAWRTDLIKLRCFSFHGGTFLLMDESSRDLLTRRGEDGTFGCCWGDDRLTLGTSGRSSSLCLAESNTLRFLVATFWQTFLWRSRDSTLKVLKHIGQGSKISCTGGSSSTALTTAAVLGGGGGGRVVLGVSTTVFEERAH